MVWLFNCSWVMVLGACPSHPLGSLDKNPTALRHGECEGPKVTVSQSRGSGPPGHFGIKA